MLDHIRRLARLEEHTPGNIADAINGHKPRPSFWTEEEQPSDHSSTYMMNWGNQPPVSGEGAASSSSAGSWWPAPPSGPAPNTGNYNYNDSSYTYLGAGEEDSEFTSTSATSSDHGDEEIDVPLGNRCST